MSVFGSNPVPPSRAARRVMAARTAMVGLAGVTIVAAAAAVLLGR